MIDIAIHNAVKAFIEGMNILDGVTFEINAGEHVALLGSNGTGKTTLFRVVVGELELDEGAVVLPQDKKLGLVSQIPVFPHGHTAEDVLREATKPLLRLRERMEAAAAALERENTDAMLREYDIASSEYERLGGYTIDADVNRVANGLSIPPDMRSQLFTTLSGGEQTRVNLARLILENTDILLLDEPTNHLDVKATEWLEEYLAKFRGTALVISHDRYFLDRTVSRCIELKSGKAEFYGGNYSFYVVERKRRYDEQLKQYEREQSEIKRLQASADRLYNWATEASIKKSQNIESRIARMKKTDRPQSDKNMRARFGEREFRGDEALILKGVCKSYGGKSVFANVEAEVRGGERIALVGDNGAGKTTLLRLITGEEKPDSGFVKRGPAIKLAYLPQHVAFDRPYASLVDTVVTETKCSVQTARNRLAAFKFPGTDAFKTVGELSGGEKSRLRLCILMDGDVNFLILDEPTNHLDITSREWIEDAVADFDGTLLFVSHDRYFCEKFATHVWDMENGAMTTYKCGYNEYRAEKSERAASTVREKPQLSKTEAKKRATPLNRQRFAERLEREIVELESRLTAISGERTEFSTDYERLMALDAEEAELHAELESKIAEWEDAVGDREF